MPENTIDVRDFVPQYGRKVTLPNGNQYSALWLDDITTAELNAFAADEAAAKGLEVFDVLRRNVKRLMPDVTDADLAALTMRELRELRSRLMQWEFQAEESDDPLVPAASPST